MPHGDLCRECGKDKYSADCPHFNSATGTYNPDGAKEDVRNGVGGSDEEAATANIKPEMSSYVEDIDAACKALSTISTFEQEADMKMLDKSYAAAVKRIKENSISIIDKAIGSICDYYDEE